MDLPVTQYAKSGDVYVAYQVFGSGSIDLVFVPGWTSHLDLWWDNPLTSDWLRGLSRFARVIMFDKRRWVAANRAASEPPSEIPSRFRGNEVETSGDGFLATFDGPARAAHCALSIIEAVRDIGIEVRAGVHTGEVELQKSAVRGIAVHIAARIVAQAAAGECLVSRNGQGPRRGCGPQIRGSRKTALERSG